ncbi:single-stranded nucleic acid binding R3H domain protein [Limnospira maxima CS-328]|uniref:Single-stranded nucleic acid binding R3H domain protein n=1 Tax=Limnospira maxima CS-328 TaxID=513049 RepID=B5W8W8_LIMMA|nr:R3H domain-containing nucleic acid-binding protein [Limnospira maxima]EDZ92026.1 single-stranded nucleic acid binding R3H domain protein [Limnospira maxima CS-328]MDC0837074.1 RNA-binding protein [Limnoraphis robusta]
MDKTQISRGQEWIEELLKLGDISGDVVPTQEEDSCWLTIDSPNLSPEQAKNLIGDGGEGLDSIQYLVNTILNLGKDNGEKVAYTVELNGYRARRYQELRALAENAASQVRQTGIELEIKSLSSVERRLIHNILKDSEGVETYSQGSEPDRRLVIKVKA